MTAHLLSQAVGDPRCEPRDLGRVDAAGAGDRDREFESIVGCIPEAKQRALESIVPILGISNIEFIYQSKMYRAGAYNDLIVKVMDNRDKIKNILQEFKTGEIAENWFPIETYCAKCNRDRVVFSKLLNHSESGITQIYDRYSRDIEKREALERWERRLLAIVSGKNARDNVVELAARAAL